MIHPRAGAPSYSTPTDPVLASVRKTRTIRPPGERNTAETSAPVTRSADPRAGRVGAASGRARPLERDEHRVGRRVAVARAPVARVEHHCVLRPLGAGKLRSGHGHCGPRGIRAQRGLRTGEVADRPQERERDLGAVADHLVLEQAVVNERQPDGPVGSVDEAS